MLKYIALTIFNFLYWCSLGISAVPTGYPISNYQDYDISTASHYYVATTGNDTTGDGTIGNPWATLGKALLSVTGNSVINLRDGNYGRFQQLSNDGYASGWVTVRSYPGESAVFTSFDMSFDERYYPSNVRFDGLGISLINDGNNDAFTIRYGQNIEIRNLNIIGYNKYISQGGISASYVDNLLVYNNSITNLTKGIILLGSATHNCTNSTISRNHIYQLSGSTMIAYSSYSSNAVIEYNNMHDSVWVSGEPNAPAEQTHGSCVSIRSSDVLINKNICRHLGSSSGIMTYTDLGSAASYHDVYIWNNLLYDIINEYVIRFYNITENIEVINNTVIGMLTGDTGSWALGQSVYVHSLFSGYDGSGLTVANNILAGWSSMPTTATVDGNIMYAASSSSDPFAMLESWPTGTNIVLTNSSQQPTDYFSSGFFVGAVNFTSGHGQDIDYRIISTSPARNYGSVSLQKETGLGAVSNGFIDFSGSVRSETAHSSGAYEYTAARRAGLIGGRVQLIEDRPQSPPE